MTTRLTKPVKRETQVLIRDGGSARPLIVRLEGSFLVLKLKGRRAEEVVDLETAYFGAIKARTFKAKMDKAKERAARKRAR